MEIKRIFFLILYYAICRYLPESSSLFFGGVSKKMRYFCCSHIFEYIGRNVNIERKAFFGKGKELSIGDNSGLGINCNVPSNLKIGKNVMMAPNCFILNLNHSFDVIDIPMIKQGYKTYKTIIEDDVWIGRDVLFTPGRCVKKGSIIAARTVLCKDFEEYSIVGGNPSKLIRNRKSNDK